MINWIVEPAVSLVLFYLAYLLFLRRMAFFHANRLYLLTAVIFSLSLPFINFSPPVSFNTYSFFLQEITVTGQSGTDAGQLPGSVLPVSRVLLITYLTVAAILGIRLILQLLHLSFMACGNKTRKYKNARIVSLESDQAPFSFLNYIFINENLYREEEKQKIIEHEMIHIHQFHTMDLILLELLIIVQWINPVAWLYRRSLHEIHEYLADDEIIKKGTSISFYQSLLLNLQLGNEFFSPASNFNKSLTFNRIRMLTALKPPPWKKIIFFILLPALILLVIMCTKTENEMAALSNESVTDTGSSNQPVVQFPYDFPASIVADVSADVFFIVEEMPGFQGGGQDAFMRYIAENLRYPEAAVENGIEGRVFIQFLVKADGSVDEAKIVRGVNPLLDEEALRVVMSSPAWMPGRQRGQAVDVAFTFPINFVLQNRD
jgi:TonB family protein